VLLALDAAATSSRCGCLCSVKVGDAPSLAVFVVVPSVTAATADAIRSSVVARER
jgi:hypothetical protein